jgi:hypothetical protein
MRTRQPELNYASLKNLQAYLSQNKKRGSQCPYKALLMVHARNHCCNRNETISVCIVGLQCHSQEYDNTDLLTYSMEQSPSWEANWSAASQALKSARHLSLSWTSSIQSTHPHPTTRRSILILSSHLRLGLPVVSLPQVSPPKPYTHLYHPPYALHAPPISFFLILSHTQYWVRSTDYSLLIM